MPDQEKANRLLRLQQQTGNLQRRIDVLKVRSDRLSRWRVTIFAVGGMGSLVAVYALEVSPGIMLALVSIVAFSIVVAIHQRIDGRLQRYEYWQQVKRQHIARINLNWDQIPLPPDPDIPEEHPFAIDLTLYKPRSLHHLLDTSATYEGSQRLMDWLIQTVPDQEQSLHRQRIVQATRNAFMFRDKLRVAEMQAGRHGRIHGEHIKNWFSQPSISGELRPILLMATPLAILTIMLLIAFVSIEIPPLFLISFFIYAFITFRKAETIGERFDRIRTLYSAFVRLQVIFGYLEQVKDEHLREVLQPFQSEPPSEDLRRLTQIMVASSARQNPILWLILNVTVPYDIFFALQLEREKERLQGRMQHWLDSLYTIEAINSLANFAYLNPEYTFATIEGGAGLQATQMGHPLLKADDKVRNDFTLAEEHDVIIITGSNMSGKSTFLRTLGVNLVLAYAGGPVDGEKLDISLFRVFSSIKVSDSINDGISYFYAEVRRLKALLNALQQDDPLPVFFMIDEIFRGTNNRERLIGSRSYISAVAKEHGVGLVATHDLELVKLSEEFPAIRNYHFREDIQDGRMVFDYQIRQGPSPTTNALRIMAIEGLPVESVTDH